MNEPSWLVALDKQIQRSKGSTKRQLQTLRERQLNKHNQSDVRLKTDMDANLEILREALRILTTPHFDIEEQYLIKRIKEALLNEAQTKADNEDFQQTLT